MSSDLYDMSDEELDNLVRTIVALTTSPDYAWARRKVRERRRVVDQAHEQALEENEMRDRWARARELRP